MDKHSTLVISFSDYLQTHVLPAYRQDSLTYALFLRFLCSQLLKLKPLAYVDPALVGDDHFRMSLAPDVCLEMLAWCLCGPLAAPAMSSPSIASLGTESSPLPGHRNRGDGITGSGRSLAESCILRLAPTSMDIDKVW